MDIGVFFQRIWREFLAMIIPSMQSLSLHLTAKAWPIRLVTFFLSALAAASVGFWTLRWPSPTPSTRLALPASAQASIDTAKLALLLGAATGQGSAEPVAPRAASAQYQLLGIISQGAKRGSALIGIDGQAPKPYRVGERLTDKWVLQSVQARSAVLASDVNAADGMRLELPPLPGTP
jgi:general secretion pathway protein C